MNENIVNNNFVRRPSLDSNKAFANRKNDSNFRIHIHSTKAVCRNNSFNTTDSLKLYEDQIILKTPALPELDEMSLLKRPLSLCFDLNSSGEEINVTDTSSSTMSSVSSSSSSSSNSKANGNISYGNNYEYEYEKIQEDVLVTNANNISHDVLTNQISSLETPTYNTPSCCSSSTDLSICSSCSTSSSSKEGSVATVIHKSALSNVSPHHNNSHHHTSPSSSLKMDNHQPYDYSSFDEHEVEHPLIEEGCCHSPKMHQVRISANETDASAKEMQEIIKIFNGNTCGMNMYEDNRNRLCCTVKMYVNLTEPVKLGLPSQLPNTSLVSSKTLLPRGGFELVTIDRSTTCKHIIEQIFSILQIQENYATYGVFEHIVNRENHKVIVKRLGYDYCLMNHLINMVRIEHDKFPSLFSSRRFVLQESERVQINWSKFTHSELINFLKILEREEKDRKEKVTEFYRNLESAVRLKMSDLKAAELK